MEVNQIFLPEWRCQLTILDPSNDPKSYIGKTVNVLAQDYDYLKQEMKVFIGNSFRGIIPLDELSIYDLSNPTARLIAPFFAKHHLVSAKIIDYNTNTNCFLLSRKENMKDALSYFSSLEGSYQTIFAYKTGVTKSSVFVDVGAGICGVIPYTEISSFRVDVSSYFYGIFHIPVRILFQNVYGKFIVSHKDCIPVENLHVGDIVTGKILRPLRENDGIFVEINPNQSGILDADYGLHEVQCDGKNLFIIEEEYPNPARCVEEGADYLFLIKYVKPNKVHFKLSLL